MCSEGCWLKLHYHLVAIVVGTEQNPFSKIEKCFFENISRFGQKHLQKYQKCKNAFKRL